MLLNEYKYPNIVELTFPADGLEFELNRRLIGFHKSRHYSRATRRGGSRPISPSCRKLVRARNIQAAAKLSREASSWDILTLVSGARRRWYAVTHAEEQKCVCQ